MLCLYRSKFSWVLEPVNTFHVIFHIPGKKPGPFLWLEVGPAFKHKTPVKVRTLRSNSCSTSI